MYLFACQNSARREFEIADRYDSISQATWLCMNYITVAAAFFHLPLHLQTYLFE